MYLYDHSLNISSMRVDNFCSLPHTCYNGWHVIGTWCMCKWMNEWTFHQVLVRILNWFLPQVCSVFTTFKNLKQPNYLGIFLQVWAVLSPDIRVHGFPALGIARQIDPFLVYCWPEGLSGLSFPALFLGGGTQSLKYEEALAVLSSELGTKQTLIFLMIIIRKHILICVLTHINFLMYPKRSLSIQDTADIQRWGGVGEGSHSLHNHQLQNSSEWLLTGKVSAAGTACSSEFSFTFRKTLQLVQCVLEA